MNRFRKITSFIRRALALQLRRMVQRRTASALARLDDRALAVIGIPRNGIGEYARELARSSVPVPPEDAYSSFSRTLTATPRMKST
ncbi:MAG: hypothetical protein ACM35H_05045 [Bacteroidota bacterium]